MVIMHDGKILLIKRTKPDVVYWVIPGGGVEKGETEEQAIIRECKEELGVDIKVKELFLEIDSKKPEIKGQKEYFYLCEVIDGKVGVGKGPEFQKDSGYFGPQNGGEEQGSCRRQGSYFERSEEQGSCRRQGSYVGKYKIEWREINDLRNIDLRPKEIKNLILRKYSK